MRIPTRTALGVSGLVFAGATVLGVSAAGPAGANTCCGGGHHRSASSASVFNKNFNFSRSDSEEAQRTHQRQFGFDHRNNVDEHQNNNNKKMMKKPDAEW
jgi:hypothetical protein